VRRFLFITVKASRFKCGLYLVGITQSSHFSDYFRYYMDSSEYGRIDTYISSLVSEVVLGGFIHFGGFCHTVWRFVTLFFTINSFRLLIIHRVLYKTEFGKI